MPRVVTCLLEYDGKILLLRRSSKVGTYRGLWGGVAGYVETHEEPFETALKEIKEEVGIDSDMIHLKKRVEPVKFTDVYEGKTYHWTIYPFLFYLKEKNPVCIDWEHTEYRWIRPEEIVDFDTVPFLKEVVVKLFKE